MTNSYRIQKFVKFVVTSITRYFFKKKPKNRIGKVKWTFQPLGRLFFPKTHFSNFDFKDFLEKSRTIN